MTESTQTRGVMTLAILSLLAACEPPGPGATGTISLAPGVDPAGFAFVHVRVFEEPADGFDVLRPVDFSGPWQEMEPLARVSFPWRYTVGPGIGGSQAARWRAVAWLSGDAAASWPGPGDPVGATPFDLRRCGDFFCDKTPGVDLVLSNPPTRSTADLWREVGPVENELGLPPCRRYRSRSAGRVD